MQQDKGNVANDPVNMVDPTGEQGWFTNVGGQGLDRFQRGMDAIKDPSGDPLQQIAASQDLTYGAAGIAIGGLVDAYPEAATKATLTVGPMGIAAPARAAVSNAVPRTLARVVDASFPLKSIGVPGKADAFVTAADDIAGMNASQIANRLTIDPPGPSGFNVIKFRTPSEGVASPVNRPDPGFVGRGRTAGGAREFVVPNRPISPDDEITRVPR